SNPRRDEADAGRPQPQTSDHCDPPPTSSRARDHHRNHRESATRSRPALPDITSILPFETAPARNERNEWCRSLGSRPLARRSIPRVTAIRLELAAFEMLTG